MPEGQKGANNKATSKESNFCLSRISFYFTHQLICSSGNSEKEHCGHTLIPQIIILPGGESGIYASSQSQKNESIPKQTFLKVKMAIKKIHLSEFKR